MSDQNRAFTLEEQRDLLLAIIQQSCPTTHEVVLSLANLVNSQIPDPRKLVEDIPLTSDGRAFKQYKIELESLLASTRPPHPPVQQHSAGPPPYPATSHGQLRPTHGLRPILSKPPTSASQSTSNLESAQPSPAVEERSTIPKRGRPPGSTSQKSAAANASAAAAGGGGAGTRRPATGTAPRRKRARHGSGPPEALAAQPPSSSSPPSLMNATSSPSILAPVGAPERRYSAYGANMANFRPPLQSAPFITPTSTYSPTGPFDARPPDPRPSSSLDYHSTVMATPATSGPPRPRLQTEPSYTSDTHVSQHPRQAPLNLPPPPLPPPLSQPPRTEASPQIAGPPVSGPASGTTHAPRPRGLGDTSGDPMEH